MVWVVCVFYVLVCLYSRQINGPSIRKVILFTFCHVGCPGVIWFPIVCSWKKVCIFFLSFFLSFVYRGNRELGVMIYVIVHVLFFFVGVELLEWLIPLLLLKLEGDIVCWYVNCLVYQTDNKIFSVSVEDYFCKASRHSISYQVNQAPGTRIILYVCNMTKITS